MGAGTQASGSGEGLHEQVLVADGAGIRAIDPGTAFPNLSGMTYLYETIPAGEGEVVKQYEIRQGMKDEPLTRHPETGEPIRRVILGGWGLVKGATRGEMAGGGGGSCGCGTSGCC